MSVTGSVTAAPRSPSSAAEVARLRQAIQQLEGVFVEQLFAAMRETVPDEGIIDRGAGEAIFSDLLDENLAAQVPSRWRGAGLEEAMMRQLRASEPTPPAAVSHRGERA